MKESDTKIHPKIFHACHSKFSSYVQLNSVVFNCIYDNRCHFLKTANRYNFLSFLFNSWSNKQKWGEIWFRVGKLLDKADIPQLPVCDVYKFYNTCGR